jgi:hypothetical protein
LVELKRLEVLVSGDISLLAHLNVTVIPVSSGLSGSPCT